VAALLATLPIAAPGLFAEPAVDDGRPAAVSYCPSSQESTSSGRLAAFAPDGWNAMKNAKPAAKKIAMAIANLVPSPTGHSPAFLFHGYVSFPGNASAVLSSIPGTPGTGSPLPYKRTVPRAS
jgi:hypothetical protein